MDFRIRYRKKRPTQEELAEEKREEQTRLVLGRGLAMGYAIPATLLGGPLAGWLIGSMLDRSLGTQHWMIVCIIVGTVGGFASMIRMLIVMGQRD